MARAEPREQHAEFDDGQAEGAATTTDATPTALLAYPVVAGVAATVRVRVAALRDDGSEGAGFMALGVFRRPPLGAAVGIGVPVVTVAGRDDASWTIALGLVGDQIVVTVAGALGKTIDWHGYLSVVEAPA